VEPKIVSMRVVKTVMGRPPSTGKSISAPADRPIQLRCCTRTRSGQARSSDMSSRSWSW
jgi:hypothetical protein